MADYEAMVQQLMDVLAAPGREYEGAPYVSKDPGTYRYREGQVEPDVGLLDPVDMLAGMLASKGAMLARRGGQALRPRPTSPGPVDIPFDRYPLPSSTIPKGRGNDVSADPLVVRGSGDDWLAAMLQAMRERREGGGLHGVQGLSADKYDRDLLDYTLRTRRGGGHVGPPDTIPVPTPIDPQYIPHPTRLSQSVDPGGSPDVIQMAMEQMGRFRKTGSEADLAYWTRVLQNWLKHSGGTTENPTGGLP
jgi:hypothetical protein